MNLPKLISFTAIAVGSVAAMRPASGLKRWDAPPIVTSNCSGCHGIDGNTQLPYFPRLAGLSSLYAEKKMAAYQEPTGVWSDELFYWVLKPKRSKDDAGNTRQGRMNMVGMSHSGNADQLKAAVVWYEKQIPAAGHAANQALVARGQELFMNGLPAQHVLACKQCHGENAQGVGPAPRLAGQNGEYIMSQLAKFRKGDRRHAPEMTMETRDLDEEQAQAAAAFLQSR